jgi:anoctamin-8
MKEFEYNDRECYKDSDQEDVFLTSQERQIIVRHMLYNLRAITGDNLNDKIRFLEGQAIGESVGLFSCKGRRVVMHSITY